MDIKDIGKRAKIAARQLALIPDEVKKSFLHKLADELWKGHEYLLTANQEDIIAGQKVGLSAALIDRLTLDKNRLSNIINDLSIVADLPDPVGEQFDHTLLENGLKICKQRVPIGVLATIYESRPNVTIDIAGLALKSGNAVILRGGSETINSNRALVKVIRATLENCQFPVDSVQFIDDPSRELVAELLKLHQYIDMLIPRGAADLHRYCRENSLIPVITGGIGICHLYVDESADLEAALNVIRNAKIQRPTVCNALDTVLINEKIAPGFLPMLVEHLSKDGVTFRIHENATKYLINNQNEYVQPASDADFDIEWLSLVLGIKVVDSIDEAIDHITRHSTGHSDGILTEDHERARQFIDRVDSAAVYVNASTRFTDGSQLGLGAEVAISTQRLHARGPMGLRELTTYKWIIEGNYHIRQ
jgi:glutamate-5-semialdehyde dehydrogenase